MSRVRRARVRVGAAREGGVRARDLGDGESCGSEKMDNER